MCTGPRASSCPPETLAWQLYEEYGYRPVELRPCMHRAQSNGPGERRTAGSKFLPGWLRQRRIRRRGKRHQRVV